MRKDRDFILLYLSDWLENGIKRNLSEAQRGCFTQLLCQAGRSPEPGTLHLLPNKPYEDEKLAQLLHVRIRTLQPTLKLLLEMGLITKDKDGIHIVNWEKDQPEWDPHGGKRKAKAKPTAITSQPSQPTSPPRTKEPWQEDKDTANDAKTLWDASINDQPLFTKLRAEWPEEKQKKVAAYIRSHPEKFQ